MAEHTKINLKADLEDQAPRLNASPGLEVRFAAGKLGLERSGLSLQRFGPGFRMPFGHQHAEQEEVYVVLSGAGRLKLDDEILELTAFDAVRIPPDRMRALEGGPDGMEVLIFGAPKVGESVSDDVAEMQPGWWSD
jgi:uncharacterized cupin superfamily protein